MWRLFGARAVGALEAVIESRLRILNGEVEDNFTEIFESFSPEQKKAVDYLLKDAAKGFLYWMLVSAVRDFPYPIDISFSNPGTDALEKICSLEDEVEVHHQYFDWIEEFSDYLDES